MKLATWNINSIRLRIVFLIKILKRYNIDVLCLQETKTEDIFFPTDELKKIGYSYLHFRGEKSYNGVAIISKIPFISRGHKNFCSLNDARHIFVVLENKISIHNFYVPAGGDIPDVKLNKKFMHKLNFLDEMTDFVKKDTSKNKIILGDLNIAPQENDVWSHKQLINVVSHTKVETDKLKNFIKQCNLIDIIRHRISDNEKVFSWWSYRNRDWKKSDRGRRLDHILISKNLVKLTRSSGIYKETRDLEKPSDHAAVYLKLNI